MNRNWTILLVLALLVAGALGYFIGAVSVPDQAVRTAPAGEAATYTCPMHPEVLSHDPDGRCPICGMALVPAKTGGGGGADAGSGDNAVHIDPQVVQNLGIRTAQVREGRLAEALRVVGSVQPDERRIEVVESRTDGWVEKLAVGAVGEPVRRGQLLTEIYSPELAAAQEEFVLALQSEDAALAQAARQRLSRFGVGKAQLDELQQTRKAVAIVRVYSPIDGIVLELGVRAGAQVMPGMAMFRLVDLSSVWMTAQIPESQAGAVRAGSNVEVRVAAVHGRVFSGKVEYVYPNLAADSRTLTARVTLDNPELVLKPGMYADLTIESATDGGEEARLLVPSDAVIRTGTRNVVIVAGEASHFRTVEVTLGVERGGDIEILSGLIAGQTVVTSGQFLIDSEASLRSGLGRLAPAETHEHAGARP